MTTGKYKEPPSAFLSLAESCQVKWAPLQDEWVFSTLAAQASWACDLSYRWPHSRNRSHGYHPRKKRVTPWGAGIILGGERSGRLGRSGEHEPMQEEEQRMELQGAYLLTCIVDRHLRAMGRMCCSHNAGLGYPIKIGFRKPLKRAGDVA